MRIGSDEGKGLQETMTNSRRKGADGERELAKKLKEYGYDTRRGQQYSGANGDADVVGLPGIHIECKRVQQLNIDEAIEQAIRDARGDEMPTVFHRKDRRPWLVTNLFSDWIELYQYKEAFEKISNELGELMSNVCDFICKEEDDYCEINCHATIEPKDCYLEYVRRTRNERDIDRNRQTGRKGNGES